MYLSYPYNRTATNYNALSIAAETYHTEKNGATQAVSSSSNDFAVLLFLLDTRYIVYYSYN